MIDGVRLRFDDYHTMPREELIAELRAWDKKFDKELEKQVAEKTKTQKAALEKERKELACILDQLLDAIDFFEEYKHEKFFDYVDGRIMELQQLANDAHGVLKRKTCQPYHFAFARILTREENVMDKIRKLEKEIKGMKK